jgi:hypothetical protein
MKTSSDKDLKTRTHNKIRFLEEQLTSLEHHFPETYHYLLEELDYQKKILAQPRVKEYFTQLDENELSQIQNSSSVS